MADSTFERTAGSVLIIAEANKATLDIPLHVLAAAHADYAATNLGKANL
jgi:hypothetical protein